MCRTTIETAIQKFSQQRVRDVPVSVSFGYAIKNDVETPFETIFKRAEDAMYQNKLAINLRYKKAILTPVLNRLCENYPALKVHSEQVGFYSSEFAQVLGFPQEEITQMRLTGLHHDMGRISIEQRLLQKKEEDLTKIELRRHKDRLQHPQLGARLRLHRPGGAPPPGALGWAWLSPSVAGRRHPPLGPDPRDSELLRRCARVGRIDR
ncbi:MAG TPA: hypothetical protein PLW59_02975 [Sphaerochaeta sp.]|nr:hypothetical protein [Sphaerochaeta sp.]